MTAYYNEIDPFAAAWLRELIKAGHIADGIVDERSIADVRPEDLAGYTQCHFFAGIGVWSHALRRAGWADDRPVWTGSCPCQPFSAAGKGGGFDDERHLWPHFHWLIQNCRPAVVLGEQVASKDGLGWLDLVQADLEGSGYTSGAVDTCAAGFGAPHIRQRLWWMAYADDDGRREYGRCLGEATGAGEGEAWERKRVRSDLADGSAVGGVAHAEGSSEPNQSERPKPYQQSGPSIFFSVHDGADGGIGRRVDPARGRTERVVGEGQDGARPAMERPGPTNGLWRDADWLHCRDGRWRAVEPGTFPLAYGAAARVGRLRGYGNAINAEAATGFIEAVMETIKETTK